MSNSRENAQEIFEACIKNVEECKKLLESQTNDEIKTNPVIKNFMEKTDESKKRIKLFSEKLRVLKSTDNCTALDNELGEIIYKLDTVSFSTIKTLKEAVAATKVSKLKKEFVKNEEILNKLGNDAKYHVLVMKLIERNNKIVKCLEFARSVLPEYFGSKAQGDGQQSKKKLFIIGDDLNKMNLNASKNLERLGEVTIHCEADASKISSAGQMPEYPSILNGFLQHENGERTEVVLKLKEKHDFNLIDFSSEESKMSATISIPGEAEEKIEVVEINLSQHEGPELLALVQNEDGAVDEVRVQLIPVTLDKPVHGKVLELQNITNEENLDDIEMDLVDDDSSILQRSRQNQEMIDTINESIKMEESIRQIQENLAPKIKQIAESVANKVVDRIMQENEMNLSAVSEIEYADLSEQSMRSPRMNFNNQSTQRRIQLQSPQGNINDISEIEYANISNVSNRSAQRSMQNSLKSRPQLMRQAGISSLGSPGGNLADISEIQYADVSERSMRSPGAQQRSMRSPKGNLVDVSEIQYADISERSLRTPVKQNQSFKSPRQNVADISEIQYADVSEKSLRTPVRQQRSMKSPGGNLNDISEIEYADISERSMRSPIAQQQRSMRNSPRQNLVDISEIQYADISEKSMKSPVAQQRSMKSPGGNLADVSEIQYADISDRSLRTPVRQQQSLKSPAGNLADVSEIEYADISERSFRTPVKQHQSMKSPGQNLADISEIQYADISEQSMKTPVRQQRSMRSPKGNLADVSEIEYADISERSFRTPVRQQKSMRSPKGNLADISEIEYADILDRSMRSPAVQQRLIKSPGQNLINISGTQKSQMRPNLRISKTPPQPPRASPRVREGILIDLSEDSSVSRNVQRNDFGGDLIQFSHDENLMNESLGQNRINFSPERVQRRRQMPNVLNSSLPLRKVTATKNLNRSLQAKPNIQVHRPFAPVDVIPSRIPEDASLNYSIGTPEEMLRLKAMPSNNQSFNLSDVEAPFSDSFKELEEQLSEATQINRKVNELRLMTSMQAEPVENFAAKFNTEQEMLEDFTLDDLSDISISEPLPPLPVQTAAEFAAKFNTSSKFLDDMTLGSDNDSFTPHSFRSGTQMQPRRPNKSLPFRNQSVTEPKLLSFDD